MKNLNVEKISIILRPQGYRGYNNLVPNLVSWIKRRKKEVIFVDTDYDILAKIFGEKKLESFSIIDKKNVFKQSDLIITLGGDGTLIGVARMAKQETTPIFGVNLGHLGFITEFSKSEFFEKLAEVLENKITINKLYLHKLEIISTERKKRFSETFINDVVVSKHDIARMFSLSVSVNDDHAYNMSGDGIIISSAIGSTAYSLAAGGPIVHPAVQAVIITPICPHGLTHRPMVVPSSDKVSVRVLSSQDNVILTVDGQKVIPLSEGDLIVVTRENKKAVHLIKNSQISYFDTLKEKFDHGRRQTK